MAKVYHDKLFPAVEEQDRKFPEDFIEVAISDTDDLGEIFHLTNHIDKAWWLNEGVYLCNKSMQPRSTSVGDLVVLSNGDVYVCRAIGWSNIGNVDQSPLTFKTGFGVLDGQ